MAVSLRDAVHANPACASALAAKDCDAIAAIMNETAVRTRPTATTLGNGTVLEVLGIPDGNTFLDFLNTTQDFRYVKPLLEQGRLEIGKTIVQQVIQSLVPAVLTQTNADKLCAVGIEPDPYTAEELHDALFNADGTEK
jgi:hypothetical protein